MSRKNHKSTQGTTIMDIRKILFVTKFEELWFDAVESLMDLRKASLEHVVFLNVIERDKVALRRGKGYQKIEEVRLREMANIRFINWAETLFEKGLEVGAYIVVGSLVKQVITAVEKEDIDLVVVGHEKKGRIEQLYSSSGILEIIRRSQTPVLVYKYKPDNTISVEKPFDRPLLATCFSNTDQKAIDYLKRMALVIKKVTIIHVGDPKSLQGSSAMGVQKTRKDIRRKLDDLCDMLVAEGIDASPAVYVGNPAKEIVMAAKECNATMVITGTSSNPSLKEKLIGSTPRYLAEKTVLPTLLIPPVTE
jgi:nucleotide-binding universal stress UspA family protein